MHRMMNAVDDPTEPFGKQDMSALHLAPEGRDYLMWCPDAEFDRAVAALDMRGLVELIHSLQDAMAVEQQTFESLSLQLEHVTDPLLLQRMSAALCTSQTRLARLCARNMRCFTQQALKSRQRDQGTSVFIDSSRSSSPRDSGLAASSNGSDVEGEVRSMSSSGSHTTCSQVPSTSSSSSGSFMNSLAFFQKAANFVNPGSKSSSIGHRQREAKRSSRRQSDKTVLRSKSSENNTKESTSSISGTATSQDNETYEQVLYINGRPQFQEEPNRRNSSGGRSCSWTRVEIRSDSPSNSRRDSSRHSFQIHDSVDSESPCRSVAFSNPAHSRSLGDVTTCVSLPRRKPVLNFGSVADDVINADSDVNETSDSECQERYLENPVNNFSTITRTQSFKEGLDLNNPSTTGSSLTRAQSLYDGLDNNFIETTNKPKLSRAPSVEEILESVKNLRIKKSAMVKSSPDLLLQVSQEKSSSSRHKSSRSSKSSKSNSSSSNYSISGVSNKSHTSESKRRKEYKYIEKDGEHDIPFYENVNNQYENVPTKDIEVIYDRPKSPKAVVRHVTDKRDKITLEHYENVNFDDPVYESVNESEPTYMNIVNSDNLYANVDDPNHSNSRSKKKSRPSTNYDSNQTYDVPKSVVHIYDTPPKQPRQVRPQSTSKSKRQPEENTYDTPHNNRSVVPQSSQILLQAKTEQIKKIDDIFADCDNDSLDGENRGKKGQLSPDIPPPDYGSEDDDLAEKKLSGDEGSPDYIDEGLGESDSRSFYADEQGLEVILEEPEDDYISSHSSAEDLRRRLDRQLRHKGERRSLGSLEGSEGIGSAEGEEEVDFHSSGSSEGGAEEDCASSGIHSEDTSSPGPPSEDLQKCPEGSQSKDEDRTQKDRCIEVYPETLRQRQRNMAPSPSKVDIKNWEQQPSSQNEDSKKFLPSVKALRNQFENGKPQTGTLGRPLSNSSSSNSLVMSSLDTSSGFGSLTSSQVTLEPLSPVAVQPEINDEPIEPIFHQFKAVDEELKQMMSKPPSTQGWNPRPLLKRLYYVPDAPKMHRQKATFINIEGYLEKLPSGRKKATFWNAWKRRYFVAKDGVLYYYQSNQTEKANMKLPLMGGKVEIMDANMVGIDDGGQESKSAGMLGIDDGKGHYVVVRCSSRQEAEKWKSALETHTVDDFSSQYIQPWPRPTNPSLLRDTLVIDIGSCSVRAGVLTSQPTLPQLFFPSVVAINRETRNQTWGIEALMPDIRATSSISFPMKPSHKISKFSVDLNAVSSLLQKTFHDLKVDPQNYNIQLSVPRVLNPNTQTELLKILFDTFGVKSVNMTHQSILALYAYNATSGIVVDIGERMDVVPVIDGYIVDGGVSRVPYGGNRIMDHLRQFLYQKNVSLTNEVDSYIIRQVLESICYCAQHYNTEKQRCTLNTESFEKTCPLTDLLPDNPQFDAINDISLDFGRFQATEGLFNPDAWGLDHPGLHKLVHKAIQECSMDIRKEMSRSIFLAGGVTQLPGISDRLSVELDNLTPPAVRPKVHASPYRYHASYLGGCVLAESAAFAQSKITKEEWTKQGNSALRKWAI